MTEADNDDVHGGKTLRFDGTVTAGNLLTAAAMLLALAVWGVRLESRVDHEVDLRSRLEVDVVRTAKTLQDSQDNSSRRLEAAIVADAARNRESDAELKAALRRIEEKFDAVFMGPNAVRPLR